MADLSSHQETVCLFNHNHVHLFCLGKAPENTTKTAGSQSMSWIMATSRGERRHSRMNSCVRDKLSGNDSDASWKKSRPVHITWNGLNNGWSYFSWIILAAGTQPQLTQYRTFPVSLPCLPRVCLYLTSLIISSETSCPGVSIIVAWQLEIEGTASPEVKWGVL